MLFISENNHKNNPSCTLAGMVLTPLVGVQSIATVPCISMGGLYYIKHLLSFYVKYTTKSMFVHILFIFILCYSNITFKPR